MRSPLPNDGLDFQSWPWSDIQPHFDALSAVPISDSNAGDWLADWSRLSSLISEVDNRLYVATTQDTIDAVAKAKYDQFLDEIYPRAKEADQALKAKFLASGCSVAGIEVPLRNMKAEADLYRDENIPLLAEQIRLVQQYEEIIGGQTALWDGEETPLPRIAKDLELPDRTRREAAFRTYTGRKLADRDKLNALWTPLFELRQRIAANAGKASFREYIWDELLRFDYRPDDCAAFRDAIAEEVVPVASRLLEARRKTLGVDVLRPWDLEVDISGDPLSPFEGNADLVAKSRLVLDRVDPELGAYFGQMDAGDLLDLESRKGKAPGGYCTNFDAVRLPFIFMNAVGTHSDVQTLIHEAGHAFHVFETAHLPYQPQLAYTSEIAEVASMGMELLASPYFDADGGFYSPAEAARARIKNLETMIMFWPYMAVVDGFQHWAYEDPEAAVESGACDAAWGKLWDRFMPGVDWTGLEAERVTGWHRKLHIFCVPFYYVEYGMAQLGACQVYRNAQRDPQNAVRQYRAMLRLGGTRPLPELFAAAGAKFAFDRTTIRECVAILESSINQLRPLAAS